MTDHTTLSISDGLFRRASMASLLAVVLAAASAPAVAAAGGDAPRGAQLFAERCAACHTVVPGVAAFAGPNLAGVVGRRAGAGAFAYSPALRAYGEAWTPHRLEDFLADPGKVVPGTRMMISVPAEADRQALVAYLGTLARK